MEIHTTGNQARVFGTAAGWSCCEQPEGDNTRNKRMLDRNLQATFSNCNSFTWEERSSGTVTILDNHWKNSGIH